MFWFDPIESSITVDINTHVGYDIAVARLTSYDGVIYELNSSKRRHAFLTQACVMITQHFCKTIFA